MARLNIETLVIDAPDDFHHHLRDGPVLASTTAAATGQFKRAIIMPNLTPPVTTTALALAYRDRILAAMPSHVSDFTPLMTLYLTDKTTGEEIRAAKASGCVYAVKLYPAGATTNSAFGVTDVGNVTEPLEAMQEVGLPLLVHGEVVAAEVDIFDREACFVESVFKPLVKRFPNLKFVMEHVTTKQGVEFVLGAGPNVAATITPQHLLYNRNGLLVGGIKPHLYCLPILKAEEHRQALLAAVASGNPKFFLGTDSAPHAIGAKESSCGCAGVFSAHAAMALYAEAFESAGALSKLSAFASHHGADFYGLSRNNSSDSSGDSSGDAPNTGRSSAASAAAETTPSGAGAGAAASPGVPGPGRRMRLTRRAVPVSATLPFGSSVLVPLRAGETLAWACEWV